MVPEIVRDIALLLTRAGVGVVFVAHGWQKLVTNGMEGTAAGFDQAGVPLPTLSAWFTALVELIGGGALIAGLATPVAAGLLVIIMFGAYVFVHAGKGIFVTSGGSELIIALGGACLLLAVFGAGRLSLDHLLVSKIWPSYARSRP